MGQTLNYLNGLFKEMIENDKPRNDHFRAIDTVIEFGLELPAELKEKKWMRNIQSTLPAEVMVVGTKTLSTIGPTVNIQPLNSNAETIKLSNAREQNIMWQFKRMEERSRHGMLSDLVESALRYDSIASFTVPVKWQLQGQKGNTPSRYKAALDNGGFIDIISNPKDIHSRFSPLGLDKVLDAKVVRVMDAVALYPEAKNLIAELKEEPKKSEFFVSVYNYWDYSERLLSISKIGRHNELVSPYGGDVIIREPMELPFLPWNIKEGGTSLATGAAHMARPILSPIVHANQLELQLIVQSMAFAEATGYAAAPRAKITSHDGETINVEYGDIQSKIILKPGESYEPVQPPQIDSNLLVIFDRIEASFNRLAGLKALASLDSPSGTAFATVNAQIKVATAALAPPKKLAERALSSMSENMLRWTAHTGDDLLGYGTQDGSLGVEYKIEAKHIDPKEIYTSVTLSHHIPTDELQQINAVTILMKEVGISFIDAAKKLNIPNPEELQARYRQEQLDNAELAIAIKMRNAEADLQIQKKQMELEAGIQQQMQAQQAMQQQQQPPQQGGGANAESESQARLANNGQRDPRSVAQAPGGQGFNTARGGSSPNQADPEGLTREGATGLDSSGEMI